MFEQNSNFFVFADQGWWENSAADEYVNDTPFSFGVGTIFETKAGLFSLTYALGKQFDIPIELQSGKVHFGFVSCSRSSVVVEGGSANGYLSLLRSDIAGGTDRWSRTTCSEV
ncbi:MAG: hypothetical protein R2818_06570 [Flavobacteriales bacterium]